MIILGDKKRKGGMVSKIMENLTKDSTDYETLKGDNEKGMFEKQMLKKESEENEVESDSNSGLNSSVEKIMEAFESKDVAKLKESLMSFIKMAMQ